MIQCERIIRFLHSIVKNNLKWKNKIYIVGSCVRNFILKKDLLSDVDLIVTSKDANEFSDWLINRFSVFFKNKKIYSNFKNNTIIKLTLQLEEDENIEIDIVNMKGNSLADDSNTRDFTINAIYINLSDYIVYDPTCKGLINLNNRELLEINSNVYINDPLRAFRIIRFISTLGFIISNDSNFYSLIENLIQNNDELLENIPKERIRDEFIKILNGHFVLYALEILINTKLLKYISFELYDNIFFDQHDKSHIETSGRHMISVFLEITNRYKNTSLELKLAGLFHDISKAYTYNIIPLSNGDFKYTYYKHELSSAKLTESILNRLKFSKNSINKVCFLIQNHTIIKEEEITEKLVKKVIRKLGKLLEEELILIDANNNCHKIHYNKKYPNNQVNKFYELLKNLNLETEEKRLNYINKFNITGIDIMIEFNIQQGPDVGKILEKLIELYDTYPELNKKELINLYKYLNMKI